MTPLALLLAFAVDGDVIDIDGHRIRLFGTDIACALVAMGHARDWPRYSKGQYEGCE